MKVLVTRPAIFAEPLCAKIAALGATPVLFPTIEFCSTPNIALLNQQLQTLNRCHMAIFTSRAAVLYGMQAIEKHHEERQVEKRLVEKNPIEEHQIEKSTIEHQGFLNFAAIGPGTANELSRFGVSSIICPKEPPYESEALLSLAEFQEQEMEGKEIMIFRGNEGRMLLYETLKERGAQVSLCEVYQRRLPEGRLPEVRKTQIPDVIIITSPKCLMNLITLVGEELWRDLQQCYFIVVGWRTYNLSATLGIRHQFLAEGADDNHILQALAHLRV